MFKSFTCHTCGTPKLIKHLAGFNKGTEATCRTCLINDTDIKPKQQQAEGGQNNTNHSKYHHFTLRRSPQA